MSAELLDRPALTQPGSGNPKVTHLVRNPGAVAEAYVMGTELVALCGYRWVPSRDPHGLPLCRQCKTIAALEYGQMFDG